MEQNRGEVERHVEGPLLAYGACFRTGSYGSMALSKATPLGGLIMNMVGKKKAGGLPQNFIVAVTDAKVQAFKYRPRGWSLKLGDEVAEWDRDTIVASAEETQKTKRVTLVSPGEDEKIVFDMPKGAISDDLIRALGAAVAA
jgi:hypothetical protein